MQIIQKSFSIEEVEGEPKKRFGSKGIKTSKKTKLNKNKLERQKNFISRFAENIKDRKTLGPCLTYCSRSCFNVCCRPEDKCSATPIVKQN